MASCRWTLLIAALTVGGVPMADASAEDVERKKRPADFNRCAKIEPAPGTPSVPSGYIFGFTEPTDLSDPCTWELSVENDGRFGKRDGRYLGISNKTEISYTYSLDVAFALSTFNSYTKWSNVSVCQDALAGEGDGVSTGTLSRFGADGFSAELFVRVLSRSPGQPLAASISFEPRWARVDSLTGYKATGYGAQLKLMMDTALADRLFAAVNISYGLGVQKLAIPNAQWYRESYAEASLAFSAEVYAAEKRFVERIVVGVEGLGASPFNGLLLNKFDGYSFFVGPTLGIGFSGDRFLSLVWLRQAMGHARFSNFSGAKDLDHDEHQQFRLKFAMPLKF